MTVEVIKARVLEGIPHGFLGRKDGNSIGIYAGLNVGLGSDDDRAIVLENQRLAAAAVLPEARLVRVHQVHSADVVNIIDTDGHQAPPKADAMVTKKTGILLGILTADCVPVLFADTRARVIGAAHAGWKGALSGVTDNTLAAMEALGADRSRIVCAVGPCIAQRSYEVDAGFLGQFVLDNPANERFFSDGKAGHYQFDIEGYVAARLAAAGVGKVECLGEDTYGQPDRYFSYRRSCHLGEAGYGRQISLIGLD